MKGWAVLGLMLVAIPGAARAEENGSGFFFDRVEVGGSSGRQECVVANLLETSRVEGQGLRLERRLDPTTTLGATLGSVTRTGDRSALLPDGVSGSLYFVVDDREMAYRVGLRWHPDEHIPIPIGSARLGSTDEIWLSASLLEPLPAFSGDDLDVGIGWHAADPVDVWIGATSPLNLDVVGGKVALKLRPFERLELGVTGRAGRNRYARLHGVAVSVSYLEPSSSAEGRHSPDALKRLLPPQPGPLQYMGAGAIAGAVGGALLAGVVDPRPCAETNVSSSLVGAVLGAVLGSFFGHAMWQ